MAAEAPGVLRGTLRLAGFAALAGLIVGSTWLLTREQIAVNLHERRMAEFATVLDGVAFDRLDYARPQVIPAGDGLPGNAPAELYRALDGAKVAAAVFVVAPSGYNGPIELMIGVRPDLSVTAVRVLSHDETPGLADDIERRRSDWITAFDGRRLAAQPDPRWALREDGGIFDGFTGASVTPTAIVLGVRDTLLWAGRHSDEVFEVAP